VPYSLDSGAGLSTPPEHSRNVKRFPGGLVFKAHRLLYHSTLGLRVIKEKKKKWPNRLEARPDRHFFFLITFDTGPRRPLSRVE